MNAASQHPRTSPQAGWKVVVLAAFLGLASPCAAAPAKAPASAPAGAKPVLVDINSASTVELARLPGLNESIAMKIVAGRPYGSKAQLVTRKLVDTATYDQIKTRIVARQPFKDARKNAAALVPPK